MPKVSPPWPQDADVYTLLGADRRPYMSPVPGTLGGYRPGKIYGRLDCPSALRWIAKGHYVKHRVFFADEATAIAAGYQPCSRCLPEKYQEWQRTQPLQPQCSPAAPGRVQSLTGMITAGAGNGPESTD